MSFRQLRSALAAATAFFILTGAAKADPNIYDYAVPLTVHSISASAKTVSANFDLLKQISSDFADAYRLKDATYSFSAPDRLEYKDTCWFYHRDLCVDQYTSNRVGKHLSFGYRYQRRHHETEYAPGAGASAAQLSRHNACSIFGNRSSEWHSNSGVLDALHYRLTERQQAI